MSTPDSSQTASASRIRRALKGSRVLVKRHLQDLAPGETMRARRDHIAVVGAVPELEGIERDMQAHSARLAPIHKDYCARVGHPVHAASIELAALVLALCERRDVKRVVDLGSGFTSRVLRDWARGRDVTVHSVDDSAEWLEKTRGYLAETGLDDARLHHWEAFAAGDFAGTFDLVVHDLGFMDTRYRVIETAVGLARPGGLVLLDDMHKPEFRDQALAWVEAQGLTAYSLKTLTRDHLTRFAYALPIPLD
jgi:SAM-dependent methyltransferase